MKKWFVPLCIAILACLSVVTLSSVSPDLMYRQLLFFFVSGCVFWGVSNVPVHTWWRWGEWLWKGLVVVLLGLLIFGRATRGATAWIDVGFGMKFQPSQFAVLTVLAAALPRFSKQQILGEKKILELLAVVGVPALLILLQPDFGTVFLYAVSLNVLIFWQKIPARYWQIFFGSLVLAGIVGWGFVLKPYQQERITSFLSGAQADQSGSGYNARQALIAVGSGSWLGRGLGHGTQSQLRFLPERQTDFIFASLAEEWGLIGSLLVIGVYTALIAFLLQEAGRSTRPSHALFLATTAVSLLIQVFVNIGMNIGLLPITGITLPLISYGGSSLLATMMLLGVAQHIILQANSKQHLRIS